MPVAPLVEIPDRYELKYLVTLAEAERIRERIRAFSHLDRASEKSPDHRYSISSLYLDTDSFAFHRAKVDRAERRFKLRVRGYDDDGGPPYFLEVKRRQGDLVKKSRAVLPSDDGLERLARADDSVAAAAPDFFAMQMRTQARPKLLVRYRREAWVSDVNTYARVTFDTDLRYLIMEDYRLSADAAHFRAIDDPVSVGEPDSRVVLELKSTLAVPRWMTALIADLDLWRRGFSKYCTGIEQTYVLDRGFHPHARVPTGG